MTQLGWYERQELTRSCQLMDANTWYGAYLRGYRKPNFPLPAIAQCYCGYSIEAHKDCIPCDYLGFFNYG